MQRRQYLRACLGVGTTAAAATAGCTDLVETQQVDSTPPVLENRPDRVYYPTHVDGMKMVGMARSENDEYAVAVTYTYPHRFWRVDSTTESVEDANLHDPDGSKDAHLMALVWDPETGRVLPEAGVTIDIAKGGEPLDEQVIYPMLSPRMGFHYGANFRLDGDGDYEVTVSVGAPNVRRTGDYRDRFEDPGSATVSFPFSTETRDNLPVERTADRAGEAAVPPVMDMDVPLGVSPDPSTLPGDHHGTAESGDARFEVLTLDSPPAGVDSDEEGYLAVLARTPHNDLVLPAMALSATVERDGESVFEGRLHRTFDSDLGYHFGAAVDASAGDDLTLSVDTIPQVARHEGYETAFLQLPDAELGL
ncbi:MAG: hypothetical protein ACI8U4_001649 [Natronomonas sp.]|jgi:hypothetical protein